MMNSILHELDRLEIKYWVDSGTLLGLVRERSLLKWDSDIDLGLLEDQLPIFLKKLKNLRNFGYKCQILRYRRKIYTIKLRPKRNSELPIHIHIYYLTNGYAWSPQVQIIPPGEESRLAVLNVFQTPVRRWICTIRNTARHCGRRANFLDVMSIAAWLLFGAARECVGRHNWSRIWPFRELYRSFTWVIPAHHFLKLDRIRIRNLIFPVPSNVEDYLALRYGDWKTPQKKWIYWADDGTIMPAAPEQVLEELQ